MKTLFIMRHAKSSWDDLSLSDFERPLNERGLRAAPLMGEFMRGRHFEPSIIISSPARRAKQTAVLAKKAAKFTGKLTFDARIYEAALSTLLDVVSEMDDACRSAMLVGHNPGMEGFVYLLTGKAERMQTAALAVVDLNIDHWGEICEGCGDLRGTFRPKDLTTS